MTKAGLAGTRGDYRGWHGSEDFLVGFPVAHQARQGTGNPPYLLYDMLVRRLFRDRLHKDDVYIVTFAERLKSDRTKALREQLNLAKENFYRKHHIIRNVGITVNTSTPIKDPCLQAVDYYLWALWRFYVNREGRYLGYLRESLRVIVDIDDKRESQTGAYYSQRKPITLDKIPPIKGKPEI